VRRSGCHVCHIGSHDASAQLVAAKRRRLAAGVRPARSVRSRAGAWRGTADCRPEDALWQVKVASTSRPAGRWRVDSRQAGAAFGWTNCVQQRGQFAGAAGLGQLQPCD